MDPEPSRRLIHFTPLRYPGGKGKLAAYVKAIMEHNRLLDGEYVEPYAGGAAIALELLMHDYVSRIHINDLSRPIYAFWASVLRQTDRLCQMVRDTPLTPSAWAEQKRVFANQDDHDDLALGFATFYLNRTNRSGILNAGIIGGQNQTGPWKIGARYNREELIYRIRSIAKLRSRIRLSGLDALVFLKAGVPQWPQKTLIYLDPPYYVKGRDLYYDFYSPENHRAVAAFVTGKLIRQQWIVSYDNVPAIRDLYKGCQRMVYEIGYSARPSSKEGREAMFFSDSLEVPPMVGPVKIVKGASMTKKKDEFSREETQRRFDAALRGAKIVGHKPMKELVAKRPKVQRKKSANTKASS